MLTTDALTVFRVVVEQASGIFLSESAIRFIMFEYCFFLISRRHCDCSDYLTG